MHCGPTVDPGPLWDSRKWKSRSPGYVWEQTTATHVHLHVPGSQNPAPKQTKMSMEKSHWSLQLTQSTVWQDMSKPLYSGCEQDTVACERTWSELALWTLHSAIAKKQNRRSTTSSRTVPSGGNRDTSYGRRMSQPPTSCGERRKTCAAPPNSWQHVDWGSKHGWWKAEEEEVETWNYLPFAIHWASLSQHWAHKTRQNQMEAHTLNHITSHIKCVQTNSYFTH